MDIHDYPRFTEAHVRGSHCQSLLVSLHTTMELGFGFKRQDESECTNQRSFDDSFGWSQTQSRESADQSEHSEDIRANAFWNSLSTNNTSIDYPKFYDNMFNASSQQESSEHISRISFDLLQVTPPEDDHDSNSNPPLSPNSNSNYNAPHSSSNQSSSPSSNQQYLSASPQQQQLYVLDVKRLEVPDHQLDQPIQPDQIFHQHLVFHLQQQQQFQQSQQLQQSLSSPLRKSGGGSTPLINLTPSPSTKLNDQQHTDNPPFNSLNLRIEINPEFSSFAAIDTDEKKTAWKDESEGKVSASPGSQFRVNPWKSKKDKQITPTEFSAGSPTFTRRESPWNLSPNALKVHNPWKSKKTESPNAEKKKKEKEDLAASSEKKKGTSIIFYFYFFLFCLLNIVFFFSFSWFRFILIS
jgi:hypothetical protein